MPPIHTRLLVTDFPACFRFYRDILQLRPTWGDEADRYASFTQTPGGEIVLALYSRQHMAEVVGTSSLPVDNPVQDKNVLIFSLPDLDAMVSRLQQQGVAFVKGPTDFPDWGCRCAYLRDPDGNLIELNGDLAVDQWSDSLREAAEKWNS
jgi:catechol 2,3-dioxygenase-like lactoylglutathione lyase family enzyme